jgi:small ligand-binding sensory domain FIST
VLRLGVGLSTEGDAARAAAEAASVAMLSGGLDRASLLLVFATTSHQPAFTRVARVAADVCGTHEVVGCSAAGVLAGEQEVEAGPGIAVLALGGEIESRRFIVSLARGAERGADDIAETLTGLPGPERLVLLFVDSSTMDSPRFLQTLARRLPGVPVVGGGASESGSGRGAAVFAGEAVASHAVAGVALGGDIRTTVGVTHAVRRVSPIHRVTAARGGTVVGLDGRPAYEAFASVVPEPLLCEPARARAVVLVGLPTEGDDFVTRRLVTIDARDGTLSVGSPIAEGQRMFFGVRDPHGARADLQSLLAAQARAWAGCSAAGALYVNCVGRGRGLHGVAGLDTAYIRQHLGSLPVAGFFSGAEIAPAGSAPLLRQHTGVLVMLGPGTCAAEGGA